MATNWPTARGIASKGVRARKKKRQRAQATREARKVELFAAKIERSDASAPDRKDRGLFAYVPSVVRDGNGIPIRLVGGEDFRPYSPALGERIQAGVTIRRDGATLLQWRTLEDRSILVGCTLPVCTVGAGASREAIASLAPTLEDPTIRYGHDGVIDYTVRKYKDHDSISSVTVFQRTHRVATLTF